MAPNSCFFRVQFHAKIEKPRPHLIFKIPHERPMLGKFLTFEVGRGVFNVYMMLQGIIAQGVPRSVKNPKP